MLYDELVKDKQYDLLLNDPEKNYTSAGRERECKCGKMLMTGEFGLRDILPFFVPFFKLFCKFEIISK